MLDIYEIFIFAKNSKINVYKILRELVEQCPKSEFNEFEPRLKSAKNRFQLSAGLNLEKLNSILSGNNSLNSASEHIWRCINKTVKEIQSRRF